MVRLTSDRPPLTFETALEKLRVFCGYTERSRQQVVRKMKTMAVDPSLHDLLLSALEKEDFLNISRYTVAYARGKSRMKGWGPNKIIRHLQYETGEEFNPDLAMEGMDKEEALRKLTRDLTKKNRNLVNDPERVAKLTRFCIGRGFSLSEAILLVKEMQHPHE